MKMNATTPTWLGAALSKRSIIFSVVVILFMSVTAIIGPSLAPHDPYHMDLSVSRLPPMWVDNPVKPGNPDFVLGTDMYGRDVLSRLLYGARVAMFLALTAVPLAALIGTIVGLAAGFSGGRTETVIMRLIDIASALPSFMFAVLMVLILRELPIGKMLNGLMTLMIGFAAVSWVGLARLIRAAVLQVKSQLFMEASRSLGASGWYQVTRHVLPNVLHLIVVWIVNTIPAVILLEAVLGYVGIQVIRSTEGGNFQVTSWGGLFFEGRSALSRSPTMLLAPALCVLLIAMSFTILGDYLNDALNHRREEI